MSSAAGTTGGVAYAFDGFRVDTLRRQVRDREGRPLELPARAFDALLYLVERPGEDVARDRLVKAVWPRTIVADNSLDQAISTLRRALGDGRNEPRYILTVPGRGYRFIAPVEVLRDDSPAPVAAAPAAPAAPTIDAAVVPGPEPRTSRRRIAVAWVLALAVAALGLLLALRAFERAPEAAARPLASVAVLPFKPLVPASADPALELGMASTLIAQLASLPDLRVLPLSSVRRYAAPDADPLAAGAELGVASVLEGSLQSDGRRLRVTVRLLDVTDGRALWSGQFDEPIAGIFDVQDAITARVAAAVAPHLSGDVGRRPRPTDDPEAYQLYAAGLYEWQRRDRDGHAAAERNLEAALARDPEYAMAWSALSGVLAVQAVFARRPPAETFPRAEAAARRAIELDPQAASGWGALGHVLVQWHRQYEEGDRLYRRALTLDPMDAQIRMWRGINLAHLGRFDEALAELRQAQSLEPRTLVYAANLGFVMFLSGDYAGAAEHLGRILQIQPEFDQVRTYLGRALLYSGRAEEALDAFAKRRLATPGGLGDLGRAYAKTGRLEAARAEIARLRELGRGGIGVAYDVATIHAALGEREAACAALEQALDDHSQLVGFLRVDPALAPLRGERCYARVFRTLYGAEPPSATATAVRHDG